MSKGKPRHKDSFVRVVSPSGHEYEDVSVPASKILVEKGWTIVPGSMRGGPRA